MPIVKLQADARPSMPRLGILRKGGPKSGNKPGADLDNLFRFVADTPAFQEEFDAAYPPNELESIEAILPYPTIDENFDAWRKEYKQNGAMNRKCDGVTIVWERGPDGKGGASNRPCMGDCNCTNDAKLFVVPAKIERMGIISVVTTSSYDISGMTRELMTVARVSDSLDRPSMAGMAVIISRKERMIAVTQNGKVMRVPKWLISIEVHPRHIKELELKRAERLRRLQGSVVGDTLMIEDARGDTQTVNTSTGEIVGGVEGKWGGRNDARIFLETKEVDLSIKNKLPNGGALAEWAVEAQVYEDIADAKAGVKLMYDTMSKKVGIDGVPDDVGSSEFRDYFYDHFITHVMYALGDIEDAGPGDVSINQEALDAITIDGAVEVAA